MPTPSATLARWGLGTRQIRSWTLYDWANSAFACSVMSIFLPAYYSNVAGGDLEKHVASAYWGYTTAGALVVVTLLSPVLGAIADRRGNRKFFLGAFMLLGVCGTACLYTVTRGEWLAASLFFIVGNIGFACSIVFYDSLLPSICTAEDTDRVSTAGFAIGYLGGGLLAVLNLLWFLKPEWFGIPDKSYAVRLTFLSVAIWWLLFSIPIFRDVPEPAPKQLEDTNESLGRLIFAAFSQLRTTFKNIRQYREVFLFLVAFWFYSDGIGTIIKMATIYGSEVGIETTHLIGAILLVQFIGVPATFAFGTFARNWGAKTGIIICLVGYTIICILGFFMSQAWHFWVLAIMVAMFQGGVQALSRSLYASMIPQEQTTEFFAFFSVSMKFAGIFGPLLFGIISQSMGSSRFSILFLIFFLLVGLILLSKVDVEKGRAGRKALADSPLPFSGPPSSCK